MLKSYFITPPYLFLKIIPYKCDEYIKYDIIHFVDILHPVKYLIGKKEFG